MPFKGPASTALALTPAPRPRQVREHVFCRPVGRRVCGRRTGAQPSLVVISIAPRRLRATGQLSACTASTRSTVARSSSATVNPL